MPIPRRRLQLFELSDQPFTPALLRDVLIETLSLAVQWGGVARGLVRPFSHFLAESGASDVLELCAGAAGPTHLLVERLLRAGGPTPRVVLTDLFPQVDAWKALRQKFPGVIDFKSEPVDATRVPHAVGKGRARVMLNAFHHFPPEVAQAILADAVQSSASIFIAEPFERNPLHFFPIVPAASLALIAVPLVSRRARVSKALLIWGTPIAQLAGVWDGVVSSLRVYTESELRDMAAPLGTAFRWTYGRYQYRFGGTGYYFFGVPSR
jgi:hypothetical protein